MAHKFKKQYGQNFLTGTSYARKLVSYLELGADERVIEIGPGDGMLTRELLESGAQVTAVEIDYSLIPKLIGRFRDFPNFELVNQDVLELEPAQFGSGPNGSQQSYKVTGSLPYNISKQIIAKFIKAANKPVKMVFIVQDEVAKAYAANAPKATFLSNWLRLFAEVKKKESIPASQFFPRPKVDGGILEITPFTQTDASSPYAEKILRIGFASPRKTLLNNLSAGLQIDKAEIEKHFAQQEISLTARPAELTIEQWRKLAQALPQS